MGKLYNIHFKNTTLEPLDGTPCFEINREPAKQLGQNDMVV